VLNWPGQRRDLTRSPNPRDEEWRDEVIRGERRLGDEAPKCWCASKTAGRSVGTRLQPRTARNVALRARTRVRRVASPSADPASITWDDRSAPLRGRGPGTRPRHHSPRTRGATIQAEGAPMKRTSRAKNRRGTRIQPHANGLVTGHHDHSRPRRATQFPFTTHRRRAEQQHRTARDVRSEALGRSFASHVHANPASDECLRRRRPDNEELTSGVDA